MWIEDDFDDRDRKSKVVRKDKPGDLINTTDVESDGKAERSDGAQEPSH